jgi:hypothetical protein
MSLRFDEPTLLPQWRVMLAGRGGLIARERGARSGRLIRRRDDHAGATAGATRPITVSAGSVFSCRGFIGARRSCQSL